MMLGQIAHIKARRRDLRREIDIAASFEEWEETCVPSYCHGNWLAAYVSWMRLFRVADLARRHGPTEARMLDFGSSVGELGHLVSSRGKGYDFIESDEQAAAFLSSRLPEAMRQTLESASANAYDLVFAVDSLEHNSDYAELLGSLVGKMAPGGVLILSGPTESTLYRLGRRIAGFDGHYHETTIYEIENAAARLLNRLEVRSLPPVTPLFRVTAWQKLEAS